VAVNYFSHTSPLNKNVFNQFGFALGGPVWIPKIFNGRNKLFFFMDYQGTRRYQYAASTNLTLPTALMRTGNFSATNGTIYDPKTGNPDGTGRLPFEGNKIPANLIDPASATLTGLLPALTRNQQFTNYDAYGNTKYTRGNWDYKVNYNASDKTMLWARYSYSPMDIVAPLVLGPAAGDAFNGGNPIHAGGTVRTAAAGYTLTLSPTVLVDVDLDTFTMDPNVLEATVRQFSRSKRWRNSTWTRAASSRSPRFVLSGNRHEPMRTPCGSLIPTMRFAAPRKRATNSVRGRA